MNVCVGECEHGELMQKCFYTVTALRGLRIFNLCLYLENDSPVPLFTLPLADFTTVSNAPEREGMH